MWLQRLLSTFRRNARKNPKPAAFDLDNKLQTYLNFTNGFFIEAGANDGHSQSNTYFLEKKLDWGGILIEGIPELYEQCKKERLRSIVQNYALVSNDFRYKTVTMHYANLMSVAESSQKTEEEREDYIKTGVDVQDLDGSYSIDVPARTLESILDNFKDLPQIDFFSLDVEGSELNVLKGSNLSKYRPKYILVAALSSEEVNTFLEEQNYELIEKMTIHDYLYRCRKKT